MDGERFVPTFTVLDGFGDVFDAMADELVQWRLAEHLLRSDPVSSGAIRCRVSQTNGTPIIFLNRTGSPDLPWVRWTSWSMETPTWPGS